MSFATDACLTQQANPDISGIGIRASFYIQNFLLVLLVNRSWEDAPSALWTFIATNLGLTISALAQTNPKASPGLSLYEAIQVSNLVWLANFGTLLSLASYSRQKRYKNYKRNEAHPAKGDTVVKLGAVLQALFSMILTLVMWNKAPTLGIVPQCNARLKFVFLFAIDVNAVTTGRIIGLTFTSIITLIFIVTTIPEVLLSATLRKSLTYTRHNAISSYLGRRNVIDDQSRDYSGNNEKTVIGQVSTFNASLLTEEPGAYAVSPSDSSSAESHGKMAGTRPRPSFYSTTRSATVSSHYSKESSGRRRWVNALDGTLIGTIAFQLVVFAYFISVNELYVLRNPTNSGNNIWGFGQIFPLIVVMPAIVSVAQAFQKHGLSRLDRREKALRSNRRNTIRSVKLPVREGVYRDSRL